MQRRFFGWIDEVVPEKPGTWIAKFTVCDGTRAWHHEVRMTQGNEGLLFTSDDEIDAAMDALARGPGGSGKAARLYGTGRIADELFGRLARSGLFAPIVVDEADYAEA